MKKPVVFVATILTFLMLMALVPLRDISVKAEPRADLDIIWYTNPDSAFTALQADEVDMIQWSLTNEQRVAVEANPDLQIGQYVENGMMEFDLNNNLTIIDYPLNTNPCHVTDFRRFIARMTDKDYVISNILLNTGSRIDVPVCYPQYLGWVDPDYVTYDWNGNGVIDPSEDNYPYPYSITEAVNLLVDMGFSDTDANGYLNYPNDAGVWMGAAGIDTNTGMPLKICIRADHAHRDAAGRMLVAALEGDPAVAADSSLATSPQWAVRGVIGGDLDTTDITYEAVRAVLSPIVMGAHNFNVYTGGWSFGRYPTYLFTLFHSMFDYSYGPNYVTDDAHPVLDVYLEDLYYSPNIAASQAASLLATAYMSQNVCNIPLWSCTSYVAWRKELVGVVNMKGYGVVNDWTFLNAQRARTTNPLRLACASGWGQLNILYSEWFFENALLDRVYNGLIATNPYDLAADIPWGAQDWEANNTWVDPVTGTEKTKVTYWLRPDCGGAQPQTGYCAGYFTAYDFEFTCWYNYAFGDSWRWSNFMDINHVIVTGTDSVDVYFDDVSMWFVYAPAYPLLGPSAIMTDMLCANATATFTGADLYWNGGQKEYMFTSDSVVAVMDATVNGFSLTESVDFYIRAGYDTFTRNVFVTQGAFAPSDVIVITYWYAIPNGAGGEYLGGCLHYDWDDTMYAYGYMYPVSISSSSAALNKNPYFQMETIPKGEIDFRWNWVSGAKPRQGFFKIDILDVVKCTGCYCHRGDGCYDPVYFPGADLDEVDLCHVGILDLVTITGKYAESFGYTPDIAACANEMDTPLPSMVQQAGAALLVVLPGTIIGPEVIIVGAIGLAVVLTAGYLVASVVLPPPPNPQFDWGKAWGKIKDQAGKIWRWTIKTGRKVVNYLKNVAEEAESISYHNLDLKGAAGSKKKWDDLQGALAIVKLKEKNMNCFLSSSSGVVDATNVNGKPHYCLGFYFTGDGDKELFNIKG